MTLEPADGIYVVSRSEGELLRMLADGLSNAAIARERNRTLPATESLIHRLFASLGLASDAGTNQRVLAVKMWLQGKVRIK
jgi:DNA-binding NarL/FixJ family response regulator